MGCGGGPFGCCLIKPYGGITGPAAAMKRWQVNKNAPLFDEAKVDKGKRESSVVAPQSMSR